MNVLTKLFKAIVGLILMICRFRIFNHRKVFDNKRIAIIGPADSAYDKLNGDYIDGFDIVLRINKALTTWKPENEKFIGKKTDILVHSFLESIETGGGELDFKLFEKHKIKYILNPKCKYVNLRQIFNAYKKYLTTKKIYIISRNKYLECENLFAHTKHGPTNGFRALYMVMSSKPKEVFITGFTFYKTPYADGYRDQLKDVKINLTHMQKRGAHDPDLEYSLFIELLEKSKSLVKLDDRLRDIIHNEVSN